MKGRGGKNGGTGVEPMPGKSEGEVPLRWNSAPRTGAPGATPNLPPCLYPPVNRMVREPSGAPRLTPRVMATYRGSN